VKDLAGRGEEFRSAQRGRWGEESSGERVCREKRYSLKYNEGVFVCIER